MSSKELTIETNEIAQNKRIPKNCSPTDILSPTTQILRGFQSNNQTGNSLKFSTRNFLKFEKEKKMNEEKVEMNEEKEEKKEENK
ncbi:hypothetical protein M0811_07262 [Anaeramoeba ignava]|uniref:Uncharacterized protein n=1 Tax=Anaeramoeba ignava TaxID=1746090 RepID=A0A9Q0LM06_ANAIG|nr:hypothetical protein M0811_07262 [Anaeramoeba ignava]